MRIARHAGRCRHAFPFLLILLGGCASGPPSYGWPPVEEIAIGGVPFFPQEKYQCGPAALATLLAWSGVEVTDDELVPLVYVPAREGSLQPEMLAQARRHGRIPYVIPPNPAALQQELAAGHPVLVLQNNGLSWLPAWHFAVVVGAKGGTLVLRSGTHRDYELEADTFLQTWRRSGYWGVVVLPLNEMPASVGPDRVLAAINDFARITHPDISREAFAAAARRWPEHTGLNFALANIDYALGNAAAAEARYRAVLASDPSAAVVRNNLAWLLAEKGELAEARVQIELARAAAGPYAAEIEDTARYIACREAGYRTEVCESRLARDAAD